MGQLWIFIRNRGFRLDKAEALHNYGTMDTKELDLTAELAQLALTDEEKLRASESLDQMLSYFEVMSQVDVAGLEPTTHALQKENRIRPDHSAFSNSSLPNPANNNLNQNNTADAILEQSPELEDRFIVIPNVL